MAFIRTCAYIIILCFCVLTVLVEKCFGKVTIHLQGAYMLHTCITYFMLWILRVNQISWEMFQSFQTKVFLLQTFSNTSQNSQRQKQFQNKAKLKRLVCSEVYDIEGIAGLERDQMLEEGAIKPTYIILTSGAKGSF